ncbi:MAG: TonB-dependent receptor [Cytophagales bacterium]
MKKEKRVWAIILIALGWLAPNLSNAQQDSIKSFNLNEVVITATKFPKGRAETGKVLTVIDQAQIERSSGKDLSQLLNEQVGLVINGANSNPGKDKSVFLRGAKTEYTVFLIDGIPVNDPSGAGGAFDPRLLTLDQIERIEILKGSQSTLYGSDAIAGVINLITRKGANKAIGGTASLGYGSYNTMKGSAGLNGSLNFMDYGIGYSYSKTDGISEAEDVNEIGTFDKDGFEQHAFNASATFKISPSFEITPFIRYSDFDGNYDSGPFTDGVGTYKASLVNPGIRTQYTLDRGTINFLYGHNSTDREFNDSFGLSEFKGRFDNVDLFSNYDITAQIQILAGLNYQNLKLLDSTLPIANPHADLMSPYLSVFLHNLEGFALEVGGRFNHHSKYGNNSTYSINPSYLINNKVKLFLNQSSGFKAPTLSQLFGNFGANEDLQPEKSISSEVGAEIAFSARVSVRATAFNRKIDDVIIYNFSTGFINLNVQDDRGFEIEPVLKLNSKWTINSYYSFVDGEVTTSENGRDSSYFNLLRRPKHTIGVNVGWQALDNLFISANLKTFSERQDLFFNPNNFFAPEQVTLESYALLDLYMEYKMFNNRLKLFVDAKNVLNQDYREVYGYNTLGINVNSGLTFSF